MSITLTNPEGLPKPDLYHQVSVATGSKVVFVAGQIAVDADGETVGQGDLATQVEQCYLNVTTALAGVGSSFEDVAKVTIYVVDWTLDKMPHVEDGMARAKARLGVAALPPVSLIGISTGFTPEIMVEIEATAAMD